MENLCAWRSRAAILLLAIMPIAAAAQAPAEPKSPPDPARLNLLAHRLLDAAMRSNGLSGDKVKPWHMKLDFELLQGGPDAKPQKGTMEEWFASQYRWRRNFSSAEPGWNGSQWSVAKLERYSRKEKHDEFDDYGMTLRVARPVVDPLYQISNLKPTDQLTVQRITANGTALNCVWFAETDSSAQMRKAEWTFPTMCFDSDLHLRLVHSEETTVQFEDIQPFQGHGVARNVKILFHGRLTADLKVTQLESVDAVDEATLKPPDKLAPAPFVIEPGMPKPVSVYEEAAHLPLNNSPFHPNSWAVPAIIHKDGTVTPRHAASPSPFRDMVDALNIAVAKWKFRPYIIDGEPVEVEYMVVYPLNLKPFVPSYERGDAADDRVPDQGQASDSSAAAGPNAMQRRGRR